jgi:hypothetical protein
VRFAEIYGSLACAASVRGVAQQRLSVSNIYGHGYDAGELARLDELGFDLRPETLRYPGSQVCSFLDFARGPALELIEVLDDREYRAFVPHGMEPYCPGISLLAADELGALEREFRAFDPYRLHVGEFTYLNFATPLVPGTFVWFSVFQGSRPAARGSVTHRNGVTGVTGLVFDLPTSDLRPLAALDVRVWGREKAAELPATDKDFPLVAVVLEGTGTDRTMRMNPRSWDLVLAH